MINPQLTPVTSVAMLKRMGAEMRELIMVEDRSQLQLERNVWSSTGFKHDIK
jgi:hypothetical protein